MGGGVAWDASAPSSRLNRPQSWGELCCDFPMSRRNVSLAEPATSYQVLSQDSLTSASKNGYGAINDTSPPVPVLYQAPPLREQAKLPIVIMMVVQFIANLTFSIIIPSQFEFIASLEGVRGYCGSRFASAYPRRSGRIWILGPHSGVELRSL